MSLATAFARFGKRFASGGASAEPTDIQADAGLEFLGTNPPTFGLHNSMFQWLDDKDNWLYRQLAAVMLAGGTTPSSGTADSATLDAIKTVVGGSGSISTNGRWKLQEGGPEIKWGQITLPASGGRTASASVVFPTAFASSYQAAFVMPTRAANSTLGFFPACAVTALSLSGLTAVGDTLGEASVNPTFNQTVPCYYFAIGS